MSNCGNTLVCWFCGNRHDYLIPGMSIGDMAYSSTLYPDFTKYPHGFQEVPYHFLRMHICTNCYSDAQLKLNPACSTTEDTLKRIREEQLLESADIDTGLIDISNIKHPYYCWLGGYPKSIVQKCVHGMKLMDVLSTSEYKLDGRLFLNKDASDNLIRQYDLDYFKKDGNTNLSTCITDHLVLEDSSVYGCIMHLRPVISSYALRLSPRMYNKHL